MSYESNTDLPAKIAKVLPDHAQDIYREAYNDAYDEIKQPVGDKDEVGRDDSAARLAWEAIKDNYHKGMDGKWYPKTRRAF